MKRFTAIRSLANYVGLTNVAALLSAKVPLLHAGLAALRTKQHHALWQELT